MENRVADVRDVREQFPVTRQCLYFDIANKSPLPQCVVDAATSFLRDTQQNGGNKQAWLAEVDTVRGLVSNLLGCTADEVAFCKNTSEGLNIAANAFPWRAGDNLVIPAGEHPNNVYPWLNLAARGVEVRIAPTEGQWVNADALRPYVDKRTRLVAVSHVSFYPGQRNDLVDLATLCEEHQAHLVVDAIQSVGLLDVNVGRLGIAVLSAGCHKGLHVPHGLGLFFCRKSLIDEMMPSYVARAGIVQGNMEDHTVTGTDVHLQPNAKRFEIGNFNFLGVHALHASLNLLLGLGAYAIEGHVLGLAETLERELKGLGLALVGPSVRERRSGICAIRLPGTGWGEYFAKHDVVLSFRRGGVRVSLGPYNNEEDVARFAELVRRRLARHGLSVP